jgi:hypothetical protein
MIAGPLVRFRRLRAEQRRYLVKASVLLGFASAAVALLPFRYAIRFGCVPLSARYPRLAEQADIVWAVQAAARRLPWRTMCIEQGIVAQRMLRSIGVEALLHYGARNDAMSGKLAAHVWVSAGGASLIGGEEASAFREIATFP